VPFEIVDPRHPSPQSLGLNCARLRKSGVLVLHRDTVEKAGVNGSAVLLLDKSTQRLALRAPREEEADLCIRPRVEKWAAKAGGVAYSVRAALTRGGWGIGKTARYHGNKTVVIRDDGMLVVLLEGGKQK